MLDAESNTGSNCKRRKQIERTRLKLLMKQIEMPFFSSSKSIFHLSQFATGFGFGIRSSSVLLLGV